MLKWIRHGYSNAMDFEGPAKIIFADTANLSAWPPGIPIGTFDRRAHDVFHISLGIALANLFGHFVNITEAKELRLACAVQHSRKSSNYDLAADVGPMATAVIDMLI